MRAIAGGAIASQGGLYLAHSSEPTAAGWALSLLAIVGGLALVAGLFTPGAALSVSVAALCIAAIGIPAPDTGFRIDRASAILVIVDGIALALLGPGAHSIDAYLFGRREIIMPPDPPLR